MVEWLLSLFNRICFILDLLYILLSDRDYVRFIFKVYIGIDRIVSIVN